jgi:hypothetical protein
LNSGVKYLFPTFAIVHLLTPKSLSSVSGKTREDHLSPQVTQALLSSHARPGVNATRLTLGMTLSPYWKEQREMLVG